MTPLVFSIVIIAGLNLMLSLTESIVKCSMANFPFSAGTYLIHVRIVANGEEVDWPSDPVMELKVENGDFYKSGIHYHGGVGPVLLKGNWSVEDATCFAQAENSA